MDAADSIVFVARVAPSSRLSLRGLFHLILAPIRRAHSFRTAVQTPGKVPRRNPQRFLYILAADPSRLAPNLETFGFPF